MNEENEINEWGIWFGIIIVITLVGGWLRVYLTGIKGLWLEETFSVWLANHSVGDMLQWIVTIDRHPPLYYLLLHYWIALNGDTPYAVRQLSVLLGAGTIPIIYLIGKRMSGVVMGLVAAMILALSPFNIRFSQEARMYTCLTFNAAVAIYALVWLLTDSRSVRPIGSQFREYLHTWRTSSPVEPDSEREFSYKVKPSNLTGWRAMIYRHRWLPIKTIETDIAWITFIVFSTATLLSDNTAIFFLLATNIFVLGFMLYQRIKKPGYIPGFQPPSFWNWVKAQVGILFLWSPWIYGFIQQFGRVYQEFLTPKPGWESVIQVFKSFLNDFMPGQSGQAMIFWILYALLVCLGLVNHLKKIPQFYFLATLFAIPLLGELIVSIRQPIFSGRTLIWITIPLFLVLAAGIVQLRFRLLIVLVAGIIGVNNLFSAGDYYKFSPREDWSNVAGYVANFVEKDDLILFNATWVQIPFDYTFKTYEDYYFLQVVKHGVPVDLFDGGVPEPRMTESDLPRLNSLLSGRQRVWLVYNYDRYTDPMGLIPRTLASGMKIIQERDFTDVKVQLYQTP